MVFGEYGNYCLLFFDIILNFLEKNMCVNLLTRWYDACVITPYLFIYLLTIYMYKADRLCNSLQQIVFSVAAKLNNTYLNNSVLLCKTFGLLRRRILYSCFDFIVLSKIIHVTFTFL